MIWAFFHIDLDPSFLSVLDGITGIVDVSEGMFGNQRSTGWIEKGLPLVDLKDAADAYDAARDTWAATN